MRTSKRCTPITSPARITKDLGSAAANRPTHRRLYIKRVSLVYLVATGSGCSMAAIQSVDQRGSTRKIAGDAQIFRGN